MQLSERAQSWARGAIIALVVATLVIVSLLSPPKPTEWQGVKQFLFIGLTLVLMGLVLCQADPSGSAGRWRRMLAGPYLPAMLLVALGALSWLTSTTKAYSGPEFLRLAGGVALFFAVAAFFRGMGRLRLLVDVLVGVVILTCLMGFVNYQATSAGGFGIIASFGNRQLFAGFLVLLAPLMVALSFADLAPSRKIAVQVAAVLSCAGLLMAQTRSAWIGLLVGLMVLAILFSQQKREERETRHARNLKVTVVPIVVLMVAATALFLGLSRTASMVGDRAATLGAPGREATLQQRQALWQGALKMVKERPLLGFGIGAYPFAQSEFANVGRPAALVAEAGPSLMEMAHNEYLQTAAEIGVPGLLAYLAMLGLFLATMLRTLKTKSNGFTRFVIIGVTAGVCAQAVDAVSNPAWRYADVSAFFWAMLGLGMAAVYARRHVEAPVAARTRASFSPARLGWQAAAVFFVAGIGYQAVAQAPRTLQLPEYVRPRSAFVRPPLMVLLPGQSAQAKMLVFFSNGQNAEIIGPRTGLTWTTSSRRGGPPTECLQELGAGTGTFQGTDMPGCLGKTFFIRGIYRQSDGESTFPAVAGTGRVKLAVPFGRTANRRP
jgi:putative inorganic carbon (HCO3(-)) transporter